MKYCPQCTNRLEDKFIDGINRKVCSAPGCNFIFWDNPLPVVAALVQYNDQIILARNAKWPDGIFSLITGFLEREETPDQAIVREVQEELGLVGEVNGFIGYYSFFKMNQIILAFWVTASGELTTGDEIAEVKYVPKEKLDPGQFSRLVITSAIVKDWLEKFRDA